MCVTRLIWTSGRQLVERREERPVQEKTYIWYRVLREASPRGGPRSVNRDCAGRNARSVKVLSPEKRLISVVAEQVWRSKTTLSEGSISRKAGTTGVQVHGMYRRPISKRESSARSRVEAQRPWPRDERQGIIAKSKSILRAEVRCLHSSDEVVETRWSEGGHGE